MAQFIFFDSALTRAGRSVSFSVGLEVDHVEVLGQDLHGVVKAQIESLCLTPTQIRSLFCKVNDGNTILDDVWSQNFSVVMLWPWPP
ncbi:MAG: hypothetical protein R3A11_01020 [Bdellovibrionota bacterium]